MSARNILMAAGGSADDKLYVNDVFSTYTYTGNGSTQTINNGIDLAGKGGLVWTKIRDLSGSNVLIDSARGVSEYLYSDVSYPKGNSSTTITSLSSSGYVLSNSGLVNASSYKYTSWTFRKAPKFFDVMTYIGDGNDTRFISHTLSVAPGMIIIKPIYSDENWLVAARETSGTYATSLSLNTTSVYVGSNGWPASGYTSTAFRPRTILDSSQMSHANQNGITYVAYLFAHDSSADGIIQCGSYIGNGYATGPNVNLGWEPQYLMVKNASGTGNWQIIDSMRGMPVGSAAATLQANLNNAESSVDYVSPTATGFQVTSTSSEVNSSGNTYIYMAIRRSNKPPTTGTQVYNAISRTGTGAAATVTGVGFAPDLMFCTARRSDTSTATFDRLRG